MKSRITYPRAFRSFYWMVLIVVGTSIISCSEASKEAVTVRNKNIDLELRKEMGQANNTLISTLKSKDVETFRTLCSDTLMMHLENKDLDTLLNQIADWLIDDSYAVLDEFYTISGDSGMNEVTSQILDEYDYSLRYKALNREMYASILNVGSDIDNMLVTAIYGKYGEEWKLNILHFNVFRMNELTAPEYLDLAKRDLNNNRLMDAALKLDMGNTVLNPGGGYWKYGIEDEFLSMHDSVMNLLNSTYIFPVSVMKVPSEPQIISIYMQRVEDGYYPMIEYQTQFNLEDTLKTREENELLHAQIDSVFYGISQEKNYILYKAYNQLSDGINEVPTYGFVKKMN